MLWSWDVRRGHYFDLNELKFDCFDLLACIVLPPTTRPLYYADLPF
jgi:hypothetical protein